MKLMASVVAVGALLVVSAALPLVAQDSRRHVLQQFADARWSAAPPFLPPGAQVALLSGDPTAAGPYALRVKFPGGYAVPARSHPTDENVVVVSGGLTFGMGDVLAKDVPANKTLTSGGYALMPAHMNHYAYTTSATTIVLFGQGPVEFKYVNPADDPRIKKTSSE